MWKLHQGVGCYRNTDKPTGSVTTKSHAVGWMKDTDIYREVLILKQVEKLLQRVGSVGDTDIQSKRHVSSNKCENYIRVWDQWEILTYRHRDTYSLTDLTTKIREWGLSQVPTNRSENIGY